MLLNPVDSYFNQIYAATNKNVLRFIIARCGNTEDINDIFQETYIELYSVLVRRGIKYIKNPEAFIMKISRQKLFAHYSMLKRLENNISLSKEDSSESDVYFSDNEIVYNIDDELCDKALLEDINNYLKLKPLITKQIFYLYYSLDTPLHEIAKLLSIGESNVKNKLYRTLKELRTICIERNGVDL